jgi:hypothetical protein
MLIFAIAVLAINDKLTPNCKPSNKKERRRLATIKQEISKYHSITIEPEALLNIYSRELFSTIDPYKNTKLEYI